MSTRPLKVYMNYFDDVFTLTHKRANYCLLLKKFVESTINDLNVKRSSK